MSLTDKACKNVQPKDKPFKLADSGGLYLHVMPNGSKYWRLKYRMNKKEKVLALGTYPFTSLLEARDGRDIAKKQIAKDIDPVATRKTDRDLAVREAESTFKVVALKWHENQKERWSEDHYEHVLRRLKTDLFPHIGTTPIAKIDVPKILEVLKKIESRGALELAGRARQLCGQVFRFAIQSGYCIHNPAANLKGALKTRRVMHFASIEPKDIPHLLSALDKNHARLYNRTRRAIMLSLLTFVRPGELRQAEWSEFDLEKGEWRIPSEKMKSRRDHIVPLSKQAIEILNEQKKETELLRTNRVFPSQTNHKKPMSDGTVRIALHKLGFKGQMTAHGFRALARTAIREELDVAPDIIEAQLAHKPAGSLGAAYDRSKFLKERRKMMQDWADYIDNQKK